MHNKPHTAEAKAKISVARKGQKPTFLGRHHSVETKVKMSASALARPWRGGLGAGRIATRQGYVKMKVPGHPGTKKDGYIFEHRLVVEGLLGRYLTSGEKVHHLNGIKDDNRPENLAIVISRRPHYGWVLCPHCQKNFMIR